MRLPSLLKRINPESDCRTDLEISGIFANSKEVKAGSLFVAVKGAKADGSEFIAEAVANGAVCVAAEDICLAAKYPAVEFVRVKDSRYALAVLADEFFNHPSEQIKAVGITGTNGKTTITYLIRAILEQAGLSSGVIGTINYSFKDKVLAAVNTTPGPLELQYLLREMASCGCDYCLMEVSSHSLEQKRTAAIDFKAAIFTNLTQDHLDYHLNMENYFLAKARLFSSLSQTAWAIVNTDSPYGLRLRELSRGKFISYGIDGEADVRAFDLKLGIDGSEFDLEYEGRPTRIKTKLIGRPNIYNILASAAFAFSQNIKPEDIQAALTKFSGVKGRLERVKDVQDRFVFVDYAHTPDALENVLAALKEFSSNRLTVVFGCGGERDRLKRPLMGRIAEKYAERIIITSDNPRGEEPGTIAGEITCGIKNKEYKVILDRKEAIACALGNSLFGETILIAGKGHEDYQIFKDRKIYFDDCEAVKECSRNVQKCHCERTK